MELNEFREQYHLTLNEQQAQAVEQVDGPVLLLSVPGSGKTTVLVARLGYMILCRGIDPDAILAVTYTRAAAADMKRRYAEKFGDNPEITPEFRTINGLCAKILDRYARKYGRTQPELLSDERKRLGIIRECAKPFVSEYLTENDLQEYSSRITYIKNMCLDADAIRELNKQTSHIAEIYDAYQRLLKQNGLMDYDDQMVFALQLLRKLPDLLAEYRTRFPYLLVDEAQDTSKLQHEIIALLAEQSRNLFMVGDEDQSIYSFRGAWPEALLGFRERWPEALILPLETNYRSTEEIVAAADRFISASGSRFEKHMRASRGSGAAVERIDYPKRTAQYEALLAAAEKCPSDTAVLYRDNDCAIPLMDLLLRRGIPFRPLQVTTAFFTHRVTADIIDLLTFLGDQYNPELFLRVYYKLRIEGVFVRKEMAEKAASRIGGRKHTSAFDALASCYPPGGEQQQKVWAFRTRFAQAADMTTSRAIDRICSLGYYDWLERSQLGTGKIELLKGLADAEPDRIAFLHRLTELQAILEAPETRGSGRGIVLSTIHSAKGLEWGTVYLMDIYDGMLPAVEDDSEDEETVKRYEEERRLFYVGITRAKDRLTLMTIRNNDASFADELVRLKKQGLPFHVAAPKSAAKPAQPERRTAPSRVQTFTDLSQVRAQRADDEARRIRAGYEEVKDRFTQQTEPIYDSFRRRWIKCGICGKIKPASEFAMYGGEKVNLGRCCECVDRLNKKHEKY